VPAQSSLSYIIYIQISLYLYHTGYICVSLYIYVHGFSRCGIQSCKADRLAGRPNALLIGRGMIQGGKTTRGYDLPAQGD
jgi:hypothetical protein